MMLSSKKIRLAAMLTSLTLLVASLPLCAAAEGGSEYLLLRTENISVPKNADGGNAAGWSVSPYPAGSYYGFLQDASGKYLGTINTNVGTAGFDKDSYASAMVYVKGDEAAKDGAKDYYVWAAGRSESARASYVAFDDSDDFIKMNPTPSGHGTMAWGSAASTSFRLTAGVHTLKIKVGIGNSSNLQAVIITDDADFTPIGKSYTELLETALVDITPPTVVDENAFSYTYSEDGKGVLTFPEASDDAAVRYVCKVGDVTEVSEGNVLTVQLSNVRPLEELGVEWYATDGLNTIKRSWNVVVSPVAAEGFVPMKAGESTALADLSTLGAGDKIRLDVKLGNRTTQTKKLKLILSLYTNNYERMSVSAETEVILADGETDKIATAELTMPENFSAESTIFSAVLWDSEEQEPYLAGIELRGAAS